MYLATPIATCAGNGDTCSNIVDVIRVVSGGVKVSENAVRKCVQSVTMTSLKSSLPEILEELKNAVFVGMDETYMPSSGKSGYVWVVSTDKAMFILTTTTRSSEVIATYFGDLVGKYAVADGYAAYPIYMIVQRCWSHELMQAENLAINGGVGSLHDILYDELRDIYYAALALSKKEDDVTDEQIEQLKDRVRVVIAKYGDHKIAGRLSRALDSLFVALTVKGMYLHNNHTKSDMRKVVVYRNKHHQFKTALGRAVFSALYSFVHTAKKNDIFPGDAILCKLNCSDWSLFGNSNEVSTYSAPEYRTPTDKECAKIEKYNGKVKRRKTANDTTPSAADTDQKGQNTESHKDKTNTTPVGETSANAKQADKGTSDTESSVSEKQGRSPNCIADHTDTPKVTLRSFVMVLVNLCAFIAVFDGTYLALAIAAVAFIMFQYKWHVCTMCLSRPPGTTVLCQPTYTQRYLHLQILVTDMAHYELQLAMTKCHRARLVSDL